MTNVTTAAGLAQESLQIVAHGGYEDFRRLVHPEAVNREARAEPPPCRGTGPDAFWATALWIREAFSDIEFRTTTVLVDGDLTVTHALMSGRHTGNFVVWTPEATVERAFAPTGRRFEVPHAHFQRVRAGQVVEHWAVRDDQGQALQLGWVPPTPAYLVRCALATRRARRASRQG